MDGLVYQNAIDARVNVNSSRQKTYLIYNGGSSNIWTNYVSTSFNDSVINLNCPPPNDRVYVPRRIWLEIKFRLNFAGASAGVGTRLLQCAGLPKSAGVSGGTANYDAPRCLPLSQAISGMQVSMNNDSLSTNLNTYSKIFQRFHRKSDQEDGELSSSPAMPDMSQSLSDMNGFVRNPLAGYGDNVEQNPRGGFSGVLVTSNTALGVGDTATVELTCIEPIWMSPFQWAENQESLALNMINSFNMQIQLGGKGSGVLSGLAACLWSHSSLGSVLTSATANVLSATAYFNYITPSRLQSLPQQINYSYAEPILYPTSTLSSVAAGASTVLNMNTVNLKSIPNCMYIWAAQRDQDFNISTSDANYFRIDRVNIQFNGQDGIMSNARSIDLYQMSKKNGYTGSFDQWNLYTGGVLCVKFGPDIGLDIGQAPGLRQNQNLSLSLTCTNLGSGAVIPSLNILVFQEGVMEINNGSIYRSVGVLDENTILRSQDQEPVQYVESLNVYGSGIWQDMGNFAKKLIRPAINVAKALVPGQFQSVVGAVDDVAKSYGYGLSGGRRIGGKLLLQ